MWVIAHGWPIILLHIAKLYESVQIICTLYNNTIIYYLHCNAGTTIAHLQHHPPKRTPSKLPSQDIRTLLYQQNRTLCVSGDGNCFFRALSLILHNTENNHQQVRHIVTFIADHKTLFAPLLIDRQQKQTMDDHLQDMRGQRCGQPKWKLKLLWSCLAFQSTFLPKHQTGLPTAGCAIHSGCRVQLMSGTTILNWPIPVALTLIASWMQLHWPSAKRHLS